MFGDVAIVAACGAGLFGALSTLVIGNRYTRNVRVLGWGGVVSGLAFATLSYFIAGWCTHGFEPIQAWILPPACLMLLLVMAAQNWFVFYEDHEDAGQSARPALVLLAAAIAALIADRYGDDRTSELQVIWAGAISLAILLSIRPVCRSIEVNRSAPVGLLVGVCKLLVPATGIAVFLLARILSSMRRPAQPEGTDVQTARPAGALTPRARPTGRASRRAPSRVAQSAAPVLGNRLPAAADPHQRRARRPPPRSVGCGRSVLPAKRQRLGRGSDAARRTRHRRLDPGARGSRALRRRHRARLDSRLGRPTSRLRARTPLYRADIVIAPIRNCLCRARSGAAARSRRP